MWHLTFSEATSAVDSAFPKRDAQTKRLSIGMELTVGMSNDSKHSPQNKSHILIEEKK